MNLALPSVLTLTPLLACAMLTLAACSSDSPEANPQSGDGAAVDAGGGPAAEIDAAAETSSSGQPSLVVMKDVKVGSFPHAIDIYAPSTAKRAVVFLHGGGGSKEGASVREIAIASSAEQTDAPAADASWLLAHDTAFILPQGQGVSPKAATWSNHVMTSGADDVAFLQALSTSLREGALTSAIPKADKVFLAGHSNGGMMANRVWCEAPSTFDAYSSLAGPPSTALTKDTCRPTVIRPFLTIIGDADTIVQTKDAWSNPLWGVNSCLQSGSGAAFVDASLQNDVLFHEAVRLPAACGEAPASPTPTADGKRSIWEACGGTIRLERVLGAEHCVVAGPMPCKDNKLLGGSCQNSLEAASGTHVRDELLAFFADVAP